MIARLLSWWQFIKTHRITIQFIAIFLAIAIILILIGYLFDWTGFNGYNKVTTTHIISGTNSGTVTRTEEYQSGKTVWDWLGLLAVLAIPVVAVIAAAWFNNQLGRANENRNNLEQEKNRQIVANQFQQTLLKEYQDHMSELLIHQDLLNSPEDSPVRKVARARTLATLLTLDEVHKGNLLQFLSESGLIDKNRSVIDLHHADFSLTKLHGAVLPSINLIGANLSNADLSAAYLFQADLSGANLNDANLEEANLENAILEEAKLSKANLYHTNLTRANLSSANLKDAVLEAASLQDANLENADLRDANLDIAWLVDANLRGAKLRGAHLGDAMFEDEETYLDAHSRAGTPKPDGSKHE